MPDPRLRLDPHPVIRAIFIAYQLRTFVHARSGNSAASIGARRAVASCPEKDGISGFLRKLVSAKRLRRSV